MVRAIAFFEIRKSFRRISTYVYFVLFFSLAYLLFITAAGAFPSVDLAMGTGGKVFANSPYLLHSFIGALSYYGLLVTAAVMGHCAYQDFLHNVFPLFFTTPITRFQYLAGRFIAAAVVLLFVFSSIGLGCLAGSWMPFLDSTLVDENRLSAFIQPYLVTVIPNMLFTGSLFFGLAALSRKILPVYVSAVILFIGYAIAAVLAQDMAGEFTAAVIDPFGNYATEYVTQYWTVAEKNTLPIPMTGVFLLNRLLWLGVGAAVFGLTLYRFRFVQGGESGRRLRDAGVRYASAANVPIPTTPASPANPLRLLPRLVWGEFLATARSVAFLLIVLCGVVLVFVSARMTEVAFGTKIYPVTAAMVEIAGGTFSLFILIIITVYAGQTVWREREAGMDQMCDVLPVPTWLPLASKLLGLMLIQVLLVVIAMLTAMFVQVTQGYFHFEPGVYLQDLFGVKLVDFCLLSVLVMLVHVVVNHKYLGHFVMVLYYLATAFMGRFGLEHHLYDYASHPSYTYSDMNGFGHFLAPIRWFNLHWAAWAVLLAIAANLLWVRGLEVRPKRRLAFALARCSRPLQIIGATALVVCVASGGFIVYNTNVLNDFRPRFDEEVRNADYEKKYKKYADLAQPRIASVRANVDVFPSRRDFRARGAYRVVNRTSEPIPTVFLSLPRDVTVHRLAVGAAGEASEVDSVQGLYTFNLPEPLEPDGSLDLDFDLEYGERGFKNRGSSTRIVYNGTFVHNGYLPRIGYMEGRELLDDSTRRKHGLAPKARMADVNDEAARRNTYICSDADWITFEATVSTTADQIAVAPGSLVREWTDGGRRYFHYKSDGPVLNFFSVLSARYQVRRDKWKDVDIEIYYHPGHEYNLDTMVKAVKRSLDYFTANFSPYQHRQVRIVEFPRYQRFAQSFPNTIPYSEGIGFIARVDPDDEKDIDYPFYVTAHEVAHQWWAHQVIGGNVQGATMLSEALSQYSALMVMKREFGAEKMKRFLRYELDRYLMGRGTERKKEVPLVLVENQPYIHYHKGSLVMYALQDYIGEENLNRALSDYARAVRFQEPPYTTSLELIEHIRKATPDELQYVLEDMFETITLFDNRAVSATYSEEEGGKRQVRIKVTSKKLRADELGAETEIAVNDLVDVGVLDKRGKYLYLERHRIDRGECEIVVPVSGVPAKAGIDPLNKLVDRKPDDNVVKVERRAAD